MNRQRSEDKMLNQMKSKFGKPSETVLAIGDWDQGGHHMRGREPTKGKGMRKTLRRAGYKVYLVDEYNTSCTCHNCQRGVVKFRYVKTYICHNTSPTEQPMRMPQQVPSIQEARNARATRTSPWTPQMPI